MTMINDIDEINIYPNGDGSFEMNIQSTIKGTDGEMKNVTIKFPKMSLSLEVYGGIGSTPGIKMVFEGERA